jgi:hypothetical protein
MTDFEISLIDAGAADYNPLEQQEDNNPISVDEKPREVFSIDADFNVEAVEPELEEPAKDDEDEPTPDPKKAKAEKAAAAPKEVKTDPIEDKEFYTTLAETLKDWQVLEDFSEEEFDGTLESLKGLMDKNKEAYHKKRLDELAANLTPAERQKLNLASEGLRTNELDDAIEELEQLKSIEAVEIETNPELAKNIYRERLLRSGFSKEKAERYVKMAEEANTLTEEAFDSKEFLESEVIKVIDSKKSEVVAAKQKEADRRIEREALLKKAVFEREEFIPGLKLNKTIKEKIYDSINKPIGTGPNGQPLNKVGMLSHSNPAEFQALLHYYTTIGLFNQDDKGNFTPDLTMLKNVAQTKVVNDMQKEASLRRKLFGQYSGGPDAETEESLLERLRRDKNKQK